MDLPYPSSAPDKRKPENDSDYIQNVKRFLPNRNFWSQYRDALQESLNRLVATNECGQNVAPDLAIATLSSWSVATRRSGGTQYFIGNGASACMASHFAIDWSKNGSLRSLAFNDMAFLTAIGNDIGYDQVFAEPVRYFSQSGDLLVSISSSGNSPNVIRALEAARERGLRLVTFSGMKSNNASRTLGDLNVYVPARTYGIVESAHQVLLHAWIDCYLEGCESDPVSTV